MHFVIAGLSGIGRSLSELLQKRGHDVVVVDADPERCSQEAESSDAMVMEGDITDGSVLEQAGARTANAFIALTDDDSDNLMGCILAKEMGTKRVVSILNDAAHAQAFKESGIDVQVKPNAVVAWHIYHTILHPYVKDYLALDSADLFELEAGAGMRCVGKRVSDMKTPKNVKLIWLEREGRILDEDAVVEPGDRLILIVYGDSAKSGSDFMDRWFKG